MSVYSPVTSMDSPGGGFVPTDRFEVDQYVRVLLGNGRTEIGQVAEILDDQITVTTLQGYDFSVSPRNVKRAFLLVLDLNGVLVARGKGTFVMRPFVEEFMRFVFTNFAVAVWTSGLERSSNPIIEEAFSGYQDRLLFKLYRDSCTPYPTAANPWGTVKDLQFIFSRFPKSFHSVNTIIVDDSPDKCSHPDIALCPIPFNDPVIQKSDDGLQTAVAVLREVLAVESHAPVIRAAEERLEAIRAGKHIVAETAKLAAQLGADPSTFATAVGAAGAERDREAENGADGNDVDGARLAEVTLWRSRLCCDHLRGACTYGDECRFSHDDDDLKRPCSRKSKCPFGHASRWIRTEGDEIVDRRRRQNTRFHDKTDVYHTQRDLADLNAPGRSHTGIPHEDARIEAEHMSRTTAATVAAAPVVAPPVRLAPAGTMLFSTDPSRQQPEQYVQPQLQPQQQHVSIPAPRGRDGARRGNCSQQQQQQHYQQQQQHPYQQQQQRPPQQSAGYGRGNGAAQPAQGAVRLTGSSTDGTALVRQLQALQAQKGRQ